MTKAVIMITTGLFLMILCLYFILGGHRSLPEGEELQILNHWELPEILNEVSGIVLITDNLMACIQDEDGIIFIYDLDKNQIQKEIVFAGEGDYESLAVYGETAYVLRSDGTIFEVKDFLSASPETTILYTYKEPGRNFEGLEYDVSNNRLLISLKEGWGKDHRPVYSFDLQTGRLNEEPAFRIAFNDPIFSELGKKPSEKFFRPSEISIHPETGKIYMLEGIVPKVLILKADGTPDKLHILNRKQFPQAEGLTFGENGEIYISNESKGAPANILQISLN